MAKVNKELMGKWVSEKITEILGFDDDIVIGLATNHIEQGSIDPKKMQMELTGFLEKQAGPFMKELWTLLVSAQSNKMGIPQVFLDRKKTELREQKELEDKRSESLRLALESRYGSASDGCMLPLTNCTGSSKRSALRARSRPPERADGAETTNDRSSH
jgi:serine/arginine repetitive matrix protein 1